MFEIIKKLEISAAHQLKLNYPSKCRNLHGHNWQIEIHCKADRLNNSGMVFDFTKIKKRISDRLDHKNLNDVLDVNPTAENIAFWIAQELGSTCCEVRVQESDGNIAIWSRDEN